MKRPGRPSDGESGDEESGGGEGRGAARRPSGDGSSNRTARRSLAARVSGEEPATDEPKDEAKARAAKPKETKKPAPKPKETRKSGPKPAKPAAAKPKVEAKGPGKKAGDAKSADRKPRDVNRPRRQSDHTDGATSKADSESRPRRRRRGVGRRVRGGARSSGATLKRGATATRKRVAKSAPKLGNRALAALGAFFAIFFAILGRVFGLAIAVGMVIGPPLRRVAIFLRRVIDGASRIATPTRVLALVVAGAAILLALSQYADYRSISIGNGAYSGVQAIAPAPETARAQAGDAHSYIFVPIAIICLLLLAGALTGRWRLLRLVTLAGFAAIVVALVVDRPAGLDPGDLSVAFEGVEATLIGGFYAQIAAGVVLAASSSLLARELRLSAAAAPARAERKPARDRSLGAPPADAGSARA